MPKKRRSSMNNLFDASSSSTSSSSTSSTPSTPITSENKADTMHYSDVYGTASSITDTRKSLDIEFTLSNYGVSTDELQRRIERYEKDFDLTTVNQSNDRATLTMMVLIEIAYEKLQQQLHQLLASEDILDKAQDIKRLSDILRDYAETHQKFQQTLGIDRRTRRSGSETSVRDYIDALLSEAKSYYETVITRVYCPTCDVMVGRFAPVHDHTAYRVSFTCSQCGSEVVHERAGSSRFSDLPSEEQEWRSAYTPSITRPESPFLESETFTFTEDVAESLPSITVTVNNTDVASLPGVFPFELEKSGEAANSAIADSAIADNAITSNIVNGITVNDATLNDTTLNDTT